MRYCESLITLGSTHTIAILTLLTISQDQYCDTNNCTVMWDLTENLSYAYVTLSITTLSTHFPLIFHHLLIFTKNENVNILLIQNISVIPSTIITKTNHVTQPWIPALYNLGQSCACLTQTTQSAGSNFLTLECPYRKSGKRKGQLCRKIHHFFKMTYISLSHQLRNSTNLT